MIRTGTILGSKPLDNSSSADLDERTLSLVRFAMSNGLKQFTTPTPDDDEQRIDWEVVNWVGIVKEKEGDKDKERPACFLVARKLTMSQFEIFGPEIKLGQSGGK